MVFNRRRSLSEDYAWNFPGVADEAEGIFGGPKVKTDVDPDIATETGILSLDVALGGGLSTGISEIYGPESSGKTALVGSILSKSQELGRPVALCGSESFDSEYFQRLGVDVRGLVLIRGDMEPALKAVMSFLRDGGVVAIDSLTSLRPLDNDDPAYWNETVFDFLSHVVDAGPTRSVLVVVSQVRAKRSADPGRLFGHGTESASRWVPDLFGVRMEVDRTEVSDYSYTMLVKLVKNLNGIPGTEVGLPVYKGYGVQRQQDTVLTALRWGVVTQRGPYFYFDGEMLGQGLEATAATIVGELELEIAKRVRMSTRRY